jgi:hypothetical protein
MLAGAVAPGVPNGGLESVLLRPRASLSVTLKIEVARIYLQTRSSATGLLEANVGHNGRSCPVQRPAMDGYVVVDLTRRMRQMRALQPGPQSQISKNV